MNKAVQTVMVIAVFGLALGQQPADPPKPTITGTVTDPSGAVIVAAKVSLFRDSESVPVAVTKTDRKGEFQFSLEDNAVFKVVAEATCFLPTTVERIAVNLNKRIELPTIILQVSLSHLCPGAVPSEDPPVMSVPSDISKSFEPPKKVSIVTVCELLDNLSQYNDTDVAVVGRLDQPGESLIDHYEFLAQDHCKHPIVTKGFVWPSKILMFSKGRLASLAKAPSAQPELDQIVLVEKVSAVHRTTKLGFHKETTLSPAGMSRLANVRDDWAVAYGHVFCSSNLTRGPCRNIGCSGFIGGAPLVIIVEKKNVHVIDKDGKLRRLFEQDDQ